MIGLTFRLAQTNLIKNRRLYYPYALMTILSTAIAYIFASLAFHPNLGEVKGASGVKQVLGLGMFVVLIALAVMIFYANSFVMKQRSKEFGVYSILGLEKMHLLLMTCLENVIFSVATVFSGLVLGLALDKLFYALLLKAMAMKVVLASTFQVTNLLLVAAYLFGIFILVSLFTIGKLGLTDSLKLVQGKKRGDRKAGFLWIQTLLGLILLGIGYYIALTVTSPLLAIPSFFGATLLVILATYLLFQAGVISLLNWLKERPNYYYQPANFISVSNLIFRMRKNAMGLATITILSSMFLVTMVGGLNIYIGGKDYVARQNPHDFSVDIGTVEIISPNQALTWVDPIMEEAQIPIKDRVVYNYREAYFSQVTPESIHFQTLEEKGEIAISETVGVGYIIDQATYQVMTGQALSLADNQVALYSKNPYYHEGQELSIGDQTLQVAQLLEQNVTLGHLPDYVSFTLPQYLVLVVPHLDMFSDQARPHSYLGYQTSLTEEEQVEIHERFLSTMFESQLWDDSLDSHGLSSLSLGYRAYLTRSFFGFAGSLFFIGLLLSLVFLMAVVLLIYFKQISEGFEDRDRFVIMIKVGLDEDQTRQSIRKQLLTVFFLPVFLAFVHLGFAYKMLQSILLAIGVVNANLMLRVTLGICLTYFLVYLLVYLVTTRSYKRIIAL